MIKAVIFQVKEMVLESLESDVVGGVAGDMKREGFSHEEVLIWNSSSHKLLNFVVVFIKDLTKHS